MKIPPFKKYQFCGAVMMACGLVNAGSIQSLMLLIGSIMVLYGLFGRLYLIHSLFKLPTGNTVVNYLLVPMSIFLLMDQLIGYQPMNMQPGMWYYLLVWGGAVLGMMTFLNGASRRVINQVVKVDDNK